MEGPAVTAWLRHDACGHLSTGAVLSVNDMVWQVAASHTAAALWTFTIPWTVATPWTAAVSVAATCFERLLMEL
jgi:hypothetical protein